MIADIKKGAEQKMAKTLETLKVDLGKVRTGRAHAGLLDHIMVDYYGTMTAVPKVANVQLADARTITVQPWEKKLVPAIEKAIRDSDLGLNPSNDGNVMRLAVPELTEERRRDLVKLTRHIAEEGRIGIRNARRDVMHDLRELKNEGEVGADDEKRAESELQKLTDEMVAELDNHLKTKEAEILEV
jgi:ribosome recycling factor